MKWDDLPAGLEWDRRLAYFLDPANSDEISKEELFDALAILSAKYCDEFYNLRFLECFIEEELGTERLESAIESSIASDSIDDRNEYVLNCDTVEERMKASHGFVTKLADEFDDLSGDLSDEDY